MVEEQGGLSALKQWQQRLLRKIPPVNTILAAPAAQELLRAHDRELVTGAITDALAEIRQAVLRAPDESAAHAAGLDAASVTADLLAARAEACLRSRLRSQLRRVINATGVVLHTNMGRSALAPEALAAIEAVAGRYSNLELDLATGERGSRYAHVEEVLCHLTGAEAGIAVNNNAGAVLLMLSALCRGKEVIVSRGELVEIGGSFRVPDVMEQSGARLVEVGTTNKTHLRDYERAIGDGTGALLKVHTSNYRIVGFTASVGVADLAALARSRGLPCLIDWGSGVMLDLSLLNPALPAEVSMPDLLAQGADLVTFSGDKLLGGPQGGFIVGRRDLVEQCRKHPLTRALRIDKLTLAGIEATLKLYLEPEKAAARIPTLRMLSMRREQIEPAAREIAARLAAALGSAGRVEVIDGESQAGGGSLPAVDLPTKLVAVTVEAPHDAEALLRQQDPPVMVRISGGQILIDPRTLWPDEYELVVSAMAASLSK
jgi:L-seryl-tRNA(Ser) seleniumtransferase